MKNIEYNMELTVINNIWETIESKAKKETTPNLFNTCNTIFDVIWENDVIIDIKDNVKYDMDTWRI
jgi:hypothetical protein